VSEQVGETLTHLRESLREVVQELDEADDGDYELTPGEQAELLEYVSGIHRILWPEEYYE